MNKKAAYLSSAADFRQGLSGLSLALTLSESVILLASFRWPIQAAVLLLLMICQTSRAAETNLGQREEDAVRAAVSRVAPSVGSIQTFGGTKAVA